MAKRYYNVTVRVQVTGQRPRDFRAALADLRREPPYRWSTTVGNDGAYVIKSGRALRIEEAKRNG